MHPLNPKFLLTSPRETKEFSIQGDSLVSALVDDRHSDRMPVESLYKHNGWLRRAIDLRAEAFAGIPYTIRRRSSGKVIYDSTDFSRVPDSLSFLEEIEDMLRLREIALVLYGRAYWRPIYRGGTLLRFDWINPSLIEEEYDEVGNVVRYKRMKVDPRTGAMAEKYYSADELVAFYQRDPFNEVERPTAPIAESVRINSDVLYSLDKFLDSFMDRGLLPATIIGVPANTPPESRNQLQQWWDKNFRGKNNSGRQKIFNADAITVTQIGQGLGELGASDIVQEQREAITAGIGVPMSHMLSSAANRATAFQEDENLYTKLLMPQAKRCAPVLNRQIFEPLGLYFRYEFARIEALQRAELEKARSLDKIVDGPLLTQDEGRATIGYEAMGGYASTLPERKNQPAPVPGAMEEEPEPLNQKALADIQRWRFKVSNKGASVPFESEEIPEYVHKAIRLRLDMGEGEGAFEPPYFDL